MGQIISAEDVIWYNANAWRKLSNTYLHQVRYGEEVNISLDNSLDENVNTFQEYQGGSPGGGQRSRPLSPLTSNNSSYASPQRAFHHRQQFATDTNGERRLYSSKTNLEVESGDRNGGGRIGEKIFGKRNADGQDGRSGSSASSSDQLDNSNLRQGVMLKNLSTSIGGGAGGTPRVMGRRKERQLAHADTSSPGVQRHYLNKSGAGVVAVPMTRLQDTNGSLESTDWMSSDDDDEEEAETTLGREWNAHDGTRRSHGVSSNRLNKTTGGGTNRINKTMPPVFAIQSKEALPPLGYTSSSEASGVKASRARHAQGSQHVRNYYSGGDRKYSAIEERRRRKLGGGGVDDGRPRKTNYLSMFKWTLGVLALVNLGCSIWAGIYMQLAYNWIERGLPIQGNYDGCKLYLQQRCSFEFPR